MLWNSAQAALLIGSSLLATRSLAAGSDGYYCKPTANDKHWPAAEDWNALNTSVSGRLVTPEPQASVCHPKRSDYNNASCAKVTKHWKDTWWHSSNPWTVDNNDETCPPDPTKPCSVKGYPSYVVKAESVSDVQQTVNFTSRTGVRLVIKNTGHDFLGRATGPDTLSLWTHKLRGIEVKRCDPRAVKYGGVAAVKVGAGMQWGEIYREAIKHNITVVGGSDPSVGVGGLVLAGGHSPVSAHFGFPADNVLEMEVVTADGQHRVINEESDADLFWAMRGGGSGFAILVSATLKAYPPVRGTICNLSMNTTVNTDTFWSLVAAWHTKIPSIAKAGGMGYPNVAPTGGHVEGDLIFPERTVKQVNDIMRPLLAGLKNGNSNTWAKDPIHIRATSKEFSNYLAEWTSKDRAGSVGSVLTIGSYLLDAEAFSENNFDELRTNLRNVSHTIFPILGNIVSGPGVRKVQIAGGGNAVLPAWRKALYHAMLPRFWPIDNTTLKQEEMSILRNNDIPALRQLAPSSGAYMNEADPGNPDWKNDYFGENYPKLLELKNKWDPNAVFWCKPCVGHELWEVRDGPVSEAKAEWGIGQVGGKVCKKDH